MISTSITPDLAPGVPMDLRARFRHLEVLTATEVFEREDQIHGFVNAFITGTSTFTLGPPGVAKTLLPERMGLRFDAQRFMITLNAFTPPDELFGPVSLKAIEDDRYERQIEGTMATADWSILDEVFKSDRVLDTMLRILCEGEYKHGTDMIKVPNSTTFTMSNELPANERLGAFWDRLLQRFVVGPLKSKVAFQQMLLLDLDPQPDFLFTWDEVLIARHEARQVDLTPVLDAVYDIRRALGQKNITLSDRRMRETLKLVQAEAWLDNCTAADVEHLLPFVNTTWNTEDQIPTVSEIVTKIANPDASKAMELLRDIEDLEREIQKGIPTDKTAKHDMGNELFAKVGRAMKALETLKTQSGTKAQTQLATIGLRLDDVAGLTLINFFDAAPSEAAGMIAADKAKRNARRNK